MPACVQRVVVAIDPRGDRAEQAPDAGQFRVFAQDRLQHRNGSRPLAFVSEVHRGPVGVEDPALLLRIGQRLDGSGRSLSATAGDEAIERAAQFLARRGAIGGEVLAFVHITLQVVQLLARRLDVPVAIVGERRQLAPAEVNPAVQRLRVRLQRRGPARALEQRLERPAAQPPGDRRLDEVENRRHEVDVLHHVGDAASGARVAFLLDDQGDVHGLFVHEQPVLFFAVVAEAFAVIRQQHDRRTVVQLVRLQVFHQPADDFVGICDLAVVRRVLGEPLRGRVRRVRLVEMQEQEGARRSIRGQPALRDLLGLGAVSRSAAGACHAEARSRASERRRACHAEARSRAGERRLVEELEALADPRVLAQQVRGHHGRCGVPAVAKHLRQQPLSALHWGAVIIAHAVLEWQSSGEQRRVGGERLRRVGVRALEQHAVRSERVDGRRADARVAVGRQVIGPQRVDRDHDDRAAERRRRPRIAPSADRRQSGTQPCQKEDEGEADRARHVRC